MPSNFRKLIVLSHAKNFRVLRLTQELSLEKLDDRHFILALAAAVTLHMLAIVAWHLFPKAQVIDVPVRALNIKLSDGEAIAEEKSTATSSPGNNVGVENTLARLVREQNQDIIGRDNIAIKSPATARGKPSGTRPLTNPKEKKFDMRSEGTNIAAPVMGVTARQFVRETEAVVSVGAPKGASGTTDAEIISRYEQFISMWIQKFKLYPDEARNASMQGETVVRIRIDRRGTVRYYALERSTGHDVLDRAAIDMIRRANPVPAAPTDYPPGELLEFLIPVNFQLQ